MSEVRTPPVKLVDLNPRWAGYYGQSQRKGMALEFECPCRAGAACPWGNSMLIPIANPIDGGPPPDPRGGTNWTRSGEDFATLSLTPSLHAVGHWHGWVRNGVLESI